jgi:dihydrofolate reductase
MIKAILAVDETGGIGKHGSIPWPSNKEDMKWFVSNTKGAVVVMGKDTWNAPGMPKPLPGRHNVVFTNKPYECHSGAQEFISGDVCEHAQILDKHFPTDVFIIGGANLIKQAFDVIDEFLLTEIPGDYDCDVKIDLDTINKLFVVVDTTRGESVIFKRYQKR